MRPRVYNFTRSFVETIDLINDPAATPPSGWSIVADGGMTRKMTFTLNNLPDKTDFTNLYAQYRLCAVKALFYFSNTGSDTGPNDLPNRQILMMMAPNRVGAAQPALTEEHFLCTQASKKRLCLNSIGKPVSVYMKLSQLDNRFAGAAAGGVDYVAVKPKFISTGETATEHYGLDIRFQRVDNGTFSTGTNVYPKVKIVYKMYLQCKQVQ